uniref:Uncharacterized protein n=1 Tax=Cacopsylla melanoneura TaxID=428564 RepID=A0A8D8WGU6_9HEMI
MRYFMHLTSVFNTRVRTHRRFFCAGQARMRLETQVELKNAQVQTLDICSSRRSHEGIISNGRFETRMLNFMSMLKRPPFCQFLVLFQNFWLKEKRPKNDIKKKKKIK